VAARAAIEPVIAEVRQGGVPFEWLRRCEAEALGERHPEQQWKPSVYEIAHRRLNE
jgi:hypothetical protein